MRKILMAGLAVLSIAAPAALASAQIVRADTVTRVDDWHACRSWDGRARACRDNDWDHNKWREREWYGRGSCASGHERYIDKHGNWRFCRR
jgi:Ni/Co efflux regulator RcnB